MLDSVSSPITRRVYNLGLDEFFEWYGREPRPGFTKATVSAWRVALEARDGAVPWHQAGSSTCAERWNQAEGRDALCANIDETESAAIITEQGGQENHRGRNQGCSSFCDQLA